MIVTLTRRALGAALLALLTVAPAFAQPDWPTRPVTVVVPFAAGGSTDAVARILAQQLSTDLGQQFLVDNRAGAVGTLGFAAVARSEPDGYTLGLGPGSTYAMAPHLYKVPRAVQRYVRRYRKRASMPPIARRYRASRIFLTPLARRMLAANERMRARMPGFFRTREASSAMVTSRT